jgi:hypothetical protein
MIEYLYDEDDELIKWAERHNPARRFRTDAHAIGLRSNGAIRAATIYDGFSGNDCLIHIATDGEPNWFTREYAVRTMAYPFIQCDQARISCLIERSNRPAVQFTVRFGGWVHEGTLREASLLGDDLLLFGMLKRDCPWLPDHQRKSMPKTAMAV